MAGKHLAKKKREERREGGPRNGWRRSFAELSVQRSRRQGRSPVISHFVRTSA